MNKLIPRGLVEYLEHGKDVNASPTHEDWGCILADAGTEYVVLETPSIRLITFISSKHRGKQLFAIVEKGMKPRYESAYVDTNYDRMTLIASDVFQLIAASLHEANKHIDDLKDKLERTEVQRDLYKDTIDTLRNNGVIE